ncbi:MAG TPA: molybdopterin-binding protein [Lautropia sp.]|nr:molybdopterin-binding protein [Lautropia sp.]
MNRHDARHAADVRRIGALIIGDEILSGKRQDKHLSQLIALLGARGLRLTWARYLGDEHELLVDALEQSFSSADIVFSFGGIGATPDDMTRQAAAQALGRPLLLHPEASALIAQRCADMAREGKGSADMGTPENRQRLKMGEFPEGSAIIPNSFNRIPGFNVEDHWFVPGFPVMAWPMVEWVLETHYRHLFHRGEQIDRSLRVYETAESVVTPLLEAIEAAFAGIKVYSLPSVGENGERRHIELGVKGVGEVVEDAYLSLRQGIIDLGSDFDEV